MHSQFSFDEMKSRYAVERRQPCQIIRADDQVPLMAQTRSAGMSAIPPLLGDKRTSRGEPISVAIDPNETSALDRRRADRSRLRLHQALLQPSKSSAAYSRINSYLMGKSASVAISHVSHTRRLRDP